MAAPKTFGRMEKFVVAVALSWGAGLADVVGYLALFHAFVSHMTGNTVATVLHSAQRNWAEVLHRGIPIPAFFLGLLAGEVTLESAKRRRRTHIASRALAIEAACLAAFLVLGLVRFGTESPIRGPSTAMFVVLVTFIAVAMGVQSASLRKVGALTMFTTFMTGTLTKLAEDLSEYLFWLRDRTRGPRRVALALRLSPRQESFQAVVFLSCLYVSYALGALAGAEGFARWGVAIAAAPLVIVVSTIGVDLVRPISPVP